MAEYNSEDAISLTDVTPGIKYAAALLEGLGSSELRSLVDKYKSKVGSGFVIIGSRTGPTVAVAVGVTQDLTDKLSAVDLVRSIIKEMGGTGGGGRPDFAQGAAKSAEKFHNAIKVAQALVIDPALEGL
jgi:alanyl-tRNA synthetase